MFCQVSLDKPQAKNALLYREIFGEKADRVIMYNPDTIDRANEKVKKIIKRY